MQLLYLNNIVKWRNGHWLEGTYTRPYKMSTAMITQIAQGRLTDWLVYMNYRDSQHSISVLTVS